MLTVTDVVVARLRLGCKYFWQFGTKIIKQNPKYVVSSGHYLGHYILNCPLIKECRDSIIAYVMLRYINENKILDILSKFP